MAMTPMAGPVVIVLTSEFVEYQGKTVKGLRIKPPPTRSNGKPAAKQNVVTQKDGYALSEMKESASGR